MVVIVIVVVGVLLRYLTLATTVQAIFFITRINLRRNKSSTTTSELMLLELAISVVTSVIVSALMNLSQLIMTRCILVSNFILVVRRLLVIISSFFGSELLVLILFALSFVLADLLDGSKRLHFQNLKFFLELIIFQRKSTAFLLFKRFELAFELVVGTLQILDELVLGFHDNNLLVQLVLQMISGLVGF